MRQHCLVLGGKGNLANARHNSSIVTLRDYRLWSRYHGSYWSADASNLLIYFAQKESRLGSPPAGEKQSDKCLFLLFLDAVSVISSKAGLKTRGSEKTTAQQWVNSFLFSTSEQSRDQGLSRNWAWLFGVCHQLLPLHRLPARPGGLWRQALDD